VSDRIGELTAEQIAAREELRQLARDHGAGGIVRVPRDDYDRLLALTPANMRFVNAHLNFDHFMYGLSSLAPAVFAPVDT
jgi:hypothetical protein